MLPPVELALLAGEILRTKDDYKSVDLGWWHVTLLQKGDTEQAIVDQAFRTSDIVPGHQMGQQRRHSE